MYSPFPPWRTMPPDQPSAEPLGQSALHAAKLHAWKIAIGEAPSDRDARLGRRPGLAIDADLPAPERAPKRMRAPLFAGALRALAGLMGFTAARQEAAAAALSADFADPRGGPPVKTYISYGRVRATARIALADSIQPSRTDAA